MTFKVRLLERSSTDTNKDAVYEAVVHTPTPSGNNGAGHAWPQVLIWVKRNTTKLKEGAGPQDITEGEKTDIEAGTKIEFTFDWTVRSNWSEQTRQADIETKAREAIALQWADIVKQHWYYGFVEEYDD
jgi:hypothetical protein